MQYNKIIDNMPQSIFRAYDIRGVVGETLTADIAYTIGLAIGSEAQRRGIKQLVIGRDGRISGPELLTALSSGIRASGMDVLNLGEITTPILYYATATMPTNSGVMLTGSHNPPDNNGIKIVLDGAAIYGEAIQNLYHSIIKCDFLGGDGKEEFNNTIIEQYIARIINDIKLARPLKVVIDCGNGVGSLVAPELFKKIGCEIIPLFCEVDGNFPNHQADPSVPKNLEDLVVAVKKYHADVGLAFDGDADRVGVVTNTGKIILPDRLLMYLAMDLLTRHPGAIIVYDVKSTRNLETEILKHNGKPLMSATGHSFVKAKMKEVGAMLAGEFSGHTFIKERWYGFDDGIYTGARLVELLAKDKRPVDAVFASLPDNVCTPELKIPAADDKKFAIIKQFIERTKIPDAKISTIDGLRADFTDGFGLLRVSNTTPYLIARFEATTKEGLQRIINTFQAALTKIDASLKIPQ